MSGRGRGEAVRRLQGNEHQSCFDNSTGHTRTSDWETLDTYPSYTTNEPHGCMDMNDGWERLKPPTQSNPNKLSNHVEDPDGEPLEMDSEDLELTRKQNELREIEEQIIQKKVALALKTVEPFVKKTIPGFCNEESATYMGETLRDRVNVILHRRQTLTNLPRSPENLPSLRKDGLLQEDHPLKFRVKALMKKRCIDPCIQPTATKVFDGLSSAKEVKSADEGFQRFLSVLNKGVDMDLFSRIVNDDSGELLNIAAESKRSNSGTSLPSPSQGTSGEDKAEPTSRGRAHNKGLCLSHKDERKHDRGDTPFCSSGRSKSPMVKKKKKKEATNPKLDEQREQLQNILKTLGLNLEVEEMSKLSDRTQERLYGKKHESRKEQGSEQRASQRHYNNSSSSSSSSSSRCSSTSSRSTSRSFSPSPSRCRRSYSRDSSESRDSKPRPASRRSSSSERSRDRLKIAEGHQDSKEPQKLCNREEKDSTYQHPSYQMYPHPHPHPHHGGFSSFPAGALSQYSQSTTFHSGQYSTDTYWTYSHGAIPAPLYSNSFSNSQNPYHHFPGAKTVYAHHNKFEDFNLLVNPDLSTSEGQSGSASGRRCLHVVSMRPAAKRVPCLTQLTKSRKKRRRRLHGKKKQKYKNGLQKNTENQREEPLQNAEITESSQKAEAEHSEEVKHQPTDEEIKANLRKKLEAFNQMVKQRLSQPAPSNC